MLSSRYRVLVPPYVWGVPPKETWFYSSGIWLFSSLWWIIPEWCITEGIGPFKQSAGYTFPLPPKCCRHNCRCRTDVSQLPSRRNWLQLSTFHLASENKFDKPLDKFRMRVHVLGNFSSRTVATYGLHWSIAGVIEPDFPHSETSPRKSDSRVRLSPGGKPPSRARLPPRATFPPRKPGSRVSHPPAEAWL
jgi:hypothetical protein